jgi:hypothetical protein
VKYSAGRENMQDDCSKITDVFRKRKQQVYSIFTALTGKNHRNNRERMRTPIFSQ